MVHSTALTRRHLIAGALAGAGILSFPCARTLVLASDTTTDLTSLGYLTLDITVAGSGYTGMADSVAAGRYLLNATFGADAGEAAAAFLSPFGMSTDDFLAFVQSAGGGGTGEATPAASDAAPAFAYRSMLAGGVYGAPGSTVQAVIDLMPGETGWCGRTIPRQPFRRTSSP